jgi:hypothetical protein
MSRSWGIFLASQAPSSVLPRLQSFCKDRLVLDPQSLLHGAVLHSSRANKLRTESASNARNYCHCFLF